MDQAFGPVVAGANIEGVIELKALLNQNAAYEFHVKVRIQQHLMSCRIDMSCRRLTYNHLLLSILMWILLKQNNI